MKNGGGFRFFKIFVWLDGKLRGKIHAESIRETEGGSEGDVDVFALENLADVSAGDVHFASKGRFVHTEFAHPREDGAEEEGADFVDCFVHGFHGLQGLCFLLRVNL